MLPCIPLVFFERCGSIIFWVCYEGQGSFAIIDGIINLKENVTVSAVK